MKTGQKCFRASCLKRYLTEILLGHQIPYSSLLALKEQTDFKGYLQNVSITTGRSMLRKFCRGTKLLRLTEMKVKRYTKHEHSFHDYNIFNFRL